MLLMLDEFRNKLDNVMYRCMKKPVIIYGYEYSGRFVAWYAQYYHSIDVSYIVTEENTNKIPYEYPLYRKSLFEFDYKNVKDAIVLLCTKNDKEKDRFLTSHGYRKNETYFDLNEIIYGKDYDMAMSDTNVQFLRFLEVQYGCDFVERMNVEDFDTSVEGMHPFVGATQKELFPLLDRCHCIPNEKDGIFDFGCGKGGAMLTFLDYGFKKVGGVEYANNLYQTLKANFDKLNMEEESVKVECIHGNAIEVKEELDDYNWFYFYDPFEPEICQKVIDNICCSIRRKPREVHLICILPRCYQYIEDTGMFVLTNQFDIMTRQRIVNVYVTKHS